MYSGQGWKAICGSEDRYSGHTFIEIKSGLEESQEVITLLTRHLQAAQNEDAIKVVDKKDLYTRKKNKPGGKFLHIETATQVCSVALSSGNELLLLKESNEKTTILLH